MGEALRGIGSSAGSTTGDRRSSHSFPASLRAEALLDVSRSLDGGGYDSDLERAELEEGRLIAEEHDALDQAVRRSRTLAHAQALLHCCTALGRLP